VEVEHIELTQYPWFFSGQGKGLSVPDSARAALPVPDEALSIPIAARQRTLPPQSAELFPHFGSAMPMLKEMLVASRSSQARV